MRTITLSAILALCPPALADDLYALAGQVSPVLYKLNPATGAVLEAHAVSGHEALFGGLAVSAKGNLYSIDGYNDGFPDRLFAINAATGAGAVIGPTGFNWNFRCVSLNPATGILMATTDNVLYTMNIATGAATLVASIAGPQLDQLTALAISPTGQAFGTDIGDTDLFSVNLTTGQATWIASIGGSGNWFSDLAFDSTGVLHGARGGGVYTIDTTTGATTLEFPTTYTGLVYVGAASPPCYANCDGSTGSPLLTANDFVCFINAYAGGQSYANCDDSTGTPALTANDFVCFINRYAAGCS